MNTPHLLAEKRYQLSVQYGQYSSQLEEVLQIKTIRWLEIRKGTKSDKSADRIWESTPEGWQETKLRMIMKAVEKEMSGISTLLRVKENEARNVY